MGIKPRHDLELSVVERGFFHLPFQHGEDSEVQRKSVELYEGLRRGATGRWLAAAESFERPAVEHKQVIDAFGRFPHRNEILGRRATDEERRYLTAGSRRYGQHG